MSPAEYQRIELADRLLLTIESLHSPAHILSVLLVDREAFRASDGRLAIDRLRDRIAARFDERPLLRRQLASVPASPPVWIEAGTIDPALHLRHCALPDPGDEAALDELIGEIASRPLDRARPLFEIWLAEGLDAGRVALVCKGHLTTSPQCDIGEALLDAPSPDRDAGAAHGPPTPAPPEPGRILLAEIEHWAGLPLRALTRPREAIAELRELASELPQQAQLELRQWLPAARPAGGRLGRGAGPRRRVATLRIDRAVLEPAAATLDVSLGDLALGALAQGLRRSLERRRVECPTGELRALVCDTDRDAAAHPMRLPVADAGPRRTLERIARQTQWRVRASAGPARSTWHVASRVAAVARDVCDEEDFDVAVFFGTVPADGLYLLGAAVEEPRVVPPLLGRAALSVCLVRAGESTTWVLVADPEAIPDLEAVAADIADTAASFRKLAQLVASADTADIQHRRGREARRIR